MFLCGVCHDKESGKGSFAICAGLPSRGRCEGCHQDTVTLDCHRVHDARMAALRNTLFAGEEAR